MGQPDVSVILCTHNPRDDYLDRVLIGLRGQTLSFQHWELLLIDNASNEPLADRFDIGWYPNGRHVRENELGAIRQRIAKFGGSFIRQRITPLNGGRSRQFQRRLVAVPTCCRRSGTTRVIDAGDQ